MKRRSAVLLALALLSVPLRLSAAPAVGSSIEVREGDSWTTVKVIGAEGRQVQVRYDDGTEEWVGPDRLKPAKNGRGDAAPPPDRTAGPATPAAVAPGSRGFAVGQAVELKRNGRWMKGNIRQVSRGWLLVVEDNEKSERRWVEPWAVRMAGSSYEIESQGTGNWPVAAGEAAPNKPPERAPGSLGDPFSVTPPDKRPVTAAQLEKEFTPLSLEGHHEPVAAEKGVLSITPPPAAGEFGAFELRGLDGQLDRLLPPLGAGKVAVASIPGAFGKWSRVVRASLGTRSQMDTRSLRVTEAKPLAAAKEGDLLLSCSTWDRHLQLWEWSEGVYKLTTNLQVATNPAMGIASASFVTPEKAVVVTKDGQVNLVDLKNKQLVSSVKGSDKAQVFVHPSGQVVGVITTSGTALLLRGEDFAILAEYPDAGQASNVSVNATGKVAAYLTSSGTARVVRVEDGKTLGDIAVGGAFTGRLDVVDEQFLLANGSTVYDVKSGMPVWIYNMPADVALSPLASGQFLIAHKGFNSLGVVVASIPDQVGRSALKNVDTSRFILKPGTAIKVDADLSGFGSDQPKAAEALNAAIQGAGQTVSAKDEAFTLTVRMAAGPTRQQDYAQSVFAGPHRRVQTLSIPSSILTATLNHQGQAVWSQEITFTAGSSIQREGEESFQDAANRASKPNAQTLRTLKIPSYLPVGAKPGTPAALGSSTLAERRFVPDRPAEPAGGRK